LGRHARIFGADIKPETMQYKHNNLYGNPEDIFVGDQEGDPFWRQVERVVAPGSLHIPFSIFFFFSSSTKF
jgi:hypothetical protein